MLASAAPASAFVRVIRRKRGITFEMYTLLYDVDMLLNNRSCFLSDELSSETEQIDGSFEHELITLLN